MTPTRMVARGMIRRCARCGGGGLYESWFRLRDRCPTCGMKFEREEGFWLGGYAINIAAGEGALVIVLAVLIVSLSNGSHINVVPYVVAGTVIAVGGPMVTFPYSRTVWCAIYLIMRPLTDEEVLAAQDFVAQSAMIEGGRPPTEDGS
ncbi:MAG: DUF983 domain-containing protein [Acidimicrobiales bacterium]